MSKEAHLSDTKQRLLEVQKRSALTPLTPSYTCRTWRIVG